MVHPEKFAQHLSAPKLKFTGSSRPEGYTAQPRSWGSTGRVSTRAELNCTEYLEEGEDHDPQNTRRLQTCNIYGDVCAHSYQYDMYIYIYTRVCVHVFVHLSKTYFVFLRGYVRI